MKWIKENKGQSFVEFALILPILLIIVMGIIEFGLMFNAYLTISNASREAARYGSLGGSDIEITERVVLVASHLDETALSVTVTPASRSRGDMLSVLVSYDYELITPIISNILSPFIDLESETIVRME